MGLRIRLLLVVLLGFSSVASAQVFNWCPLCFMVSYVDIPAANVNTPVPASGFMVAGWGFVCEGGAPADRVDIFYSDDQGVGHYLPQADGALSPGLYRPDVQVALSGSCPAVSADTGWQLEVTNTPPLGARTLYVNVWRGPYYQTHVRSIVVQ